jgi:hypothetical protein
MPGKINVEGLKLRHEALISEYKALRQSIMHHSEMQGQADNIAMLALGGSIPLALALLSQPRDLTPLLLLIPILFFIIAFTQLRHERLLLVTAMYIDEHIRPQTEKLLSSLSTGKAGVFEWEKFLARRTWAPNLFLEWLSVCTRGIIGFASGLGIIGIYTFIWGIGHPVTALPYGFDILLAFINIIIFAGDLAIVFGIASIRYHYLMKYYKK